MVAIVKWVNNHSSFLSKPSILSVAFRYEDFKLGYLLPLFLYFSALQKCYPKKIHALTALKNYIYINMSALGSGVCAVPNFSLEDILQILLFLVLAQLHWVAWELGGFQTILCFKKACRGVVLFSASGFPGIQLAFCSTTKRTLSWFCFSTRPGYLFYWI